VDRIYLIQDRFQWETSERGNVPSVSIKVGELLD
jgi:hypothetical protein